MIELVWSRNDRICILDFLFSTTLQIDVMVTSMLDLHRSKIRRVSCLKELEKVNHLASFN